MAKHEKLSATEPRRKHVLLTVLGTNPRAARYGLGEREVEAQLAPAALFELLSTAERPDLLLALCTTRAKKESWPLIEQALSDRCELRAIDVPDGETQEDVGEYLMRVATAVPNDVELTVDVTHGYRHLSFLTYVAVLYLAALRGVRVRGAYYGLLRSAAAPRGELPNASAAQTGATRPISPFLDLRPLLELPRWLHALETLRETGSTVPLADALRAGPQHQSARGVSDALFRISEAYLSGLPLELGREAERFRSQCLKPLRRLLRDDHRLPISRELADRIEDMMEPFALAPASGKGWKRDVALSPAELSRQARVIDDLLRRGSAATALGLMNEWTASWVVWRLDRQHDWLDYSNARRGAGRLLGAVADVARNPNLRHLLTEEQRALGDFWRELCDLRNAYAHHGMRHQVVVGDPKIAGQLERIRDFWQKTLRACPEYSLSLGAAPDGRVLVSPVGQRPGVLFSAMRACLTNGKTGAPVTCLAICSRETEEFIAEAARRAGHTGKIEPLRLDDPYGGTEEIPDLEKAAQGYFIGAEVLVNVTGGTTLMGLAAEALANTARELACPVRRFGLIDRRPPDRQMADPYQIGEPFWLDRPNDDDHDDD